MFSQHNLNGHDSPAVRLNGHEADGWEDTDTSMA